MLKAKHSRRDSEAKSQAIAEAAKEDTTRLNAIIPERLHTEVKLRAIHEKSSITEIVIKALREYLSKSSNE